MLIKVYVNIKESKKEKNRKKNPNYWKEKKDITVGKKKKGEGGGELVAQPNLQACIEKLHFFTVSHFQPYTLILNLENNNYPIICFKLIFLKVS